MEQNDIMLDNYLTVSKRTNFLDKLVRIITSIENIIPYEKTKDIKYIKIGIRYKDKFTIFKDIFVG